MSESWIGLIMDSAAHLLIFSMPTQSHNFGNNNDGYGCSKIALMWS
jgi:hypothetical protein